MNLEETLNQIESLVEGYEQGDFLFPDLKPLFNFIETTHTLPVEYQERTKDLFLRIAAMEKSTPFGRTFYEGLWNSDLPFTQEVFESATYTEPYYNCEGAAILGYFITVLRNNGFESFHYLIDGSLEEDTPRPILQEEDIKPEDYAKVTKAIIHGIKRKSPFKLYKALKGALVFKNPEFVRVLETVLKQNIVEMERFADPEIELNKYLSLQPGNTYSIAFTLYKLNGEERYRKITELIEGEEHAMYDAAFEKIQNYHERFAQVYSQITELLE